TPTGGPRADADPDLGIRALQGNWREIMSTHWFHDHMLDFTAPNVYKGNVAMFNMYSAVDRGNEAVDDGISLPFPSGTALNWGNRDYDVNLVLADKAWDSDGQLFFNIFELDGWLGDQMLTNWLWKPFFEVRARRYRFRILNGSVSRYFRIALVEEVNGTGGELAGLPGSGISYNRIPFHMICNDGNIMEHSVLFDGNSSMGGHLNRKGILPTQGIAERYDIIIDFAQFAPGTTLYFVNVLEHDDGKRPQNDIPLADVLDGTYHGRNAEPADQPDVVNGRYESDACVTRFLQFRVLPYAGTDLSLDPGDYVANNGQGPGGSDLTMIPLPIFTQAELDNAIHRTFEFGRSSGTDQAPWTIKTDGGSGLGMDPRRLSASVNKSRVEIWHIENGGGGWSHPIHVHFEEGQIFQRGGNPPPEWERWARKDIYRIGRMDDSTDSVDFVIRFREFLGSYMEHCHNTQHEDHAMLLRWDIENPGQVLVLPTPMPSWDGVSYVQTFALPTFRIGDEDAAEDFDEFGHVGGN
ncbi:MAG: multicopper oxidase domain-containing protein, partial [Planctomycetes bacterium]|nr:multicopper oxidase domain-containing protein [Planctomycetota bacterium]